jgi:hypothetical protein
MKNNEKMTGRELCRAVLESAREPLTAEEVCDVADRKGYFKQYRSSAEDPTAAIKALLYVEAKKKDGEFIGDKSFPVKFDIRKGKIIQPPKITSKSTIPQEVRHKVWMDFWGNCTNGMCIVCGDSIQITSFACAHIEAYSISENNDISNLAPTCEKCNRGMKTMDLREYKKKYHPNIDVHSIKDIFTDYITKEEVINCLEKYAKSNKDAKIFLKAVEMLKNN